MCNQISFFQILHKCLEYLLFSFIKVSVIKFIQCWPCFINGKRLLAHPLDSLMDSTTSLKVKTMEGERVGARSLVHITLGVEGHVGAPGWGLGKVTSKLITHIDLHKPNKLVSV
jgi:hypothetical protein